jgi:uncharacterized protein YlxW (UPF0749 family)
MAEKQPDKEQSQIVVLQSKRFQGLQGYLLFAILGGFVAWMIWGQPRIDVDVEAYQLQIKLLEQKVDSLNNKNLVLEKESDSLYNKITTYTNRINNLNTRINVIRKETQAKLDAVNDFSTNELQQFFTDRYGFNKDSIN